MDAYFIYHTRQKTEPWLLNDDPITEYAQLSMAECVLMLLVDTNTELVQDHIKI